MSLQHQDRCVENNEATNSERIAAADPQPQEIQARCELIRSRWTLQENLRRIRRARGFHEWLLALSDGCLATR